MFLRAHMHSAQTCIHLNVSSEMHLRCTEKALPFSGFQQVLWYTKLQSAYRQILLHWVRHDFIAASATFRLHSHCFSLSLFEEGISSMFSQTACPWLFQLLCFHLKSSESMIQKYSYRNPFLLKEQYHTFISTLQPSKSKIALSYKHSYKPSL